MLATALEYAERGWRVFPLRINSKLPPRGLFWRDQATTEEDRLRLWFGAASDYNIAVTTGTASRLVVIDVDSQNNGLENWGRWCVEHDFTPTTYAVRTPSGGMHYYYRTTEPYKTFTGLLPGVDVRGEGGYVAAPPSAIDSCAYTVMDPDEDIEPLPTLLADFLPLVAETPSEPPKPQPVGQYVHEGGRNSYLTKVAGRLRRIGLNEESIESALHGENLIRCDPPLPQSEVRIIARSIGRYDPADPITVPDTPEKTIVRASEYVAPMLAFLRDKDRVKGEPTGFASLDRLLGGGKRLGEMTAWHAEAKTGKNAFWHKMMHMWLTRDIPMAYASRELDPPEEVLPNILSIEFKKNVWLEDVDDDNYQRAIDSWPLYFAPGHATFPIEDVGDWMRDLVRMGVHYFWFDHLHYMLEDPEEHRDAVLLCRRLRELTRQLKVHTDIIIQPNKLAQGETLGKNSFKGGSAIAQLVNSGLLLWRDKELDNTLNVKMDFGRSRLIRTGVTKFQYDPVTTDYTELVYSPPSVGGKTL